MPEDIEKIEIELFLAALRQRYGYDFSQYAQAALRRRVRYLVAQAGCARVSDIIPRVLYDEEFGRSVIQDFSITVTEMFRDPAFYRALRGSVVPYLLTFPFIKVWHAGCATGEEVYSLAIVLREEGLDRRAHVYATDINDAALQKARDGIYPLKSMQQYTANYQQAGGRRSFAEYYHAQYESVIMDQALRANVTFASHNLVTDGVFSEVQLALCRNVLIYFDRALQNRVLRLLADSLVRGGFLCLGTKETLEFSDVRDEFRVVDEPARIYQKTSA